MDLKDTFLSLPNWGRISLVGGAGILGIMMLSKQSKSAELMSEDLITCDNCGNEDSEELFVSCELCGNYSCDQCGDSSRCSECKEMFCYSCSGCGDCGEVCKDCECDCDSNEAESFDAESACECGGFGEKVKLCKSCGVEHGSFKNEKRCANCKYPHFKTITRCVRCDKRMYGAESFEADAEGEEEFKGYHENDCHICERPYDFSKIARGLVQHYLKESDNGTNDWKAKGNPEGTRRTARNVAGSELYWYGLEALEHYMAKGKESKIKPLVIDLIRKAIVPNVIAGDVHSFIESLEIEGIDTDESMLSKEDQEKWRADEFEYNEKAAKGCVVCGIGPNLIDFATPIICNPCLKAKEGFHGAEESRIYCEWCKEDIASENESDNIRGETVCRDCAREWMKEAKGDGRFWAEEFEANEKAAKGCVVCGIGSNLIDFATPTICNPCLKEKEGFHGAEEFEARTYRKTPTRSKGESKSKIDAKRRRYRQSQTTRKSNAESFEAPQKKTRLNSKQKKQRYVSNKIKKIMRDWKKSGKIGTSTPKTSKAAQRQAIAVAYSFAERRGHGAESNYFKEVHCKCGAQLHWDNVSKHWFCSACGYSAKKSKGLEFNSESDYLEMRQEHGDHDDAHKTIEDLDKLTAFCITFLDEGAYGGESQGLKDVGGGLREEIVLYVEGSIQMKFVYDSEGQNIAIRVKYTHDSNSPVIYLPKAAFIATKPDDIEEHH